MTEQSRMNHSVFLVIVGLLGWAVPGAGHFVIKERKRAIIIFVTISATFLLGLYVGSIGVINPVQAKLWYVGQMLTTPAVSILADITKSQGYVCYGKSSDIGQIYTAVAGMLNLLCVISAVYMAHSGRGELIGEDEDV